MRFHLIDRLDLVQPHERVVARKLTSHRETYWRDDGQGPQMPSALIFEALCQAGTWLVMSSTNFDKRAALLSVDSLEFGPRPVRPGNVLQIEGFVDSIGPEVAVLSGSARVNGEMVLSAQRIMCALMPAAELEDVESIRRIHRQLDRPVQLARRVPGRAA